ncbi:hypothetical protein REPUB_Repub15cG0031500 [Reevesia pubescens]
MARRKGKRARTCEDGNKGKGKEAKGLLTYLPTVIVMDILSRLPLKSLLNCRYVCKTWLQQIISDPHFSKLHQSRSAINILNHNGSPRCESRNILLYQIDKAPQGDRIQIDEMKFTPRFNLPNSSFELVNSCNGLLCLCRFLHKSLHVCNPCLEFETELNWQQILSFYIDFSLGQVVHVPNDSVVGMTDRKTSKSWSGDYDKVLCREIEMAAASTSVSCKNLSVSSFLNR